MGYQVSDSGGEDFVPAPEGTHLAVCYGVYYIGMQKFNFKGKAGVKPKLILSFALPGVLDDEGKPLVVNAFFTASLSSRSKLRPALEAWRGRKFSEQELKGFDVSKLRNVPCMATVSHTTGDVVKAYVSAMTAIPKGVEKPALLSDTQYYSVDPDPESCKFDEIPDWIKAQCLARVKTPAGPPSSNVDVGDDDLPF